MRTLRSRATLGAVLLLTLAVGCEHKSKSSESTNQPPANQNQPPANKTPEPGKKDPGPPAGMAPPPAQDEVRPPVPADLAEYLKDVPGKGKLIATFDTSMGAIHCELYEDKAPVTVANFVGLATGKNPWKNPRKSEVATNTPFYDGIIFHRVIPEFMIQGGGPARRRHGRPRLPVPGRVRPRAADEAARARHGERGPGHQRQPRHANKWAARTTAPRSRPTSWASCCSALRPARQAAAQAGQVVQPAWRPPAPGARHAGRAHQPQGRSAEPPQQRRCRSRRWSRSGHARRHHHQATPGGTQAARRRRPGLRGGERTGCQVDPCWRCDGAPGRQGNGQESRSQAKGSQEDRTQKAPSHQGHHGCGQAGGQTDEIQVFGQEVHSLSQDALDQMRARIGFLFQSNSLYDSMTVEENLLSPLRRHWITAETTNADDAVNEALDDVGLLHTRHMMPSELSGGMRKRIALARTLILKPEIILYDEPTTGLDPITSREISDLIVSVQKKYNTASMLISHDMNCIHATANRVVMLIDGRCYANDTFEPLARSADEIVQAFFLETV